MREDTAASFLMLIMTDLLVGSGGNENRIRLIIKIACI
jgi:hypothetical protein